MTPERNISLTIVVSIVGLIAIYMLATAISDSDWFQKKWKNAFSYKKRTKIKLWTNIVLLVTLTVLVGVGINCGILDWGIIAVPLILGTPYLIGIGIGIFHARIEAGQNTIQEMFSKEMPTNEIAKEALVAIGCNPIFNSDGSLSVSYQGDDFVMDFYGNYVRIWNSQWSYIEANNPDLPKLQAAINLANFEFGPTVVMRRINEKGVITLHSRIDIMLHPLCPDNNLFIKSILNSFFETKENVQTEFRQILTQEMNVQKKRNPVGFNTNHSTSTDI